MPDPRAAYRELTPAAFALGIFLGVLMTAAFVYIALKLGFSMPGSTVAAILGFAVLRGALRRGTIVENNINQTIASAVNTASAGVTFTLPALFILSLADPSLRVDPIPPALAAIAGSFLGIVFIIPLRKQMIELERLRFPSGIAVASILRSPGAGARQAKLLAGGFAVAASLHLPAFYGWIPEVIAFGPPLGLPAHVPLALGISFASIGAGLLSGRGGLPFVFGGMLAWWVVSPLAFGLGWVPAPAEVGLAARTPGYEDWSVAGVLYAEMLRPLGIGVLIGGALSGVVASFPALRSAVQGLSKAARSGALARGGADELGLGVLGAGVAGAVVVLFVAAVLSSPGLGLGQALLIAIVGTLWLALAGLIVAQATGMTDISPISGMSLIGVTLMFFLSGRDVIACIVLGVAVSIGIGQCADMMTDLKSGHLIGARPFRQQLAQFSVGWIGVPVAIAVLFLLWHQGGGFGPLNPNLSAPQGSALAAVIGGLGEGAAPLDKYVTGTAIGLGLGIFPISGVGVLVGLAMYLPFHITLTYGLGCFLSIGLQALRGSHWIASTLVPVAAGFIIGEALTNLVLVLVSLGGG